MNPPIFRIPTGLPTVHPQRRRRPKWTRPPLRWHQYGAVRMLALALGVSLLAALCNG